MWKQMRRSCRTKGSEKNEGKEEEGEATYSPALVLWKKSGCQRVFALLRVGLYKHSNEAPVQRQQVVDLN